MIYGIKIMKTIVVFNHIDFDGWASREVCKYFLSRANKGNVVSFVDWDFVDPPRG